MLKGFNFSAILLSNQTKNYFNFQLGGMYPRPSTNWRERHEGNFHTFQEINKVYVVFRVYRSCFRFQTSGQSLENGWSATPATQNIGQLRFSLFILHFHTAISSKITFTVITVAEASTRTLPHGTLNFAKSCRCANSQPVDQQQTVDSRLHV